MSYCRFSEGHVYVFTAAPSNRFPDGSLECCGCWFGATFNTVSVDEFVSHLERHIAAGHSVPSDVIPSIREDFPDGVAKP